MIIVIANSKGGVGKSTIAVHLAVWLHEQGHRVILADCDMQHSSSQWLAETAPEIQSVRMSNPDDIIEAMRELNQQADYIVADGPGSNSEISRALLCRGDFAFVPCKASMLEVRALSQATKVVRQVQEMRNGRPFTTIILSMVGKNYRLTQDMKDAAAALDMGLAETIVTQKQIYADAPGQKSVVWNLKGRGQQAGKELKTLFAEILPFACKVTTGKKNRKATSETDALMPEISYL